MKRLWVDDARSAPPDYDLARNYEEAITLINENDYELISLDFALGDPNGNGFDILKYIDYAKRYPQKLEFHTGDFTARREMREYFRTHFPSECQLLG